MCGIAGILSLKNSSYKLAIAINKMSKKIAHRGPDFEGFVLFNKQENYTATSKEFTILANQNYSPKNYIEELQVEVNLALAHRRLSIIDLSEKAHQPMCDSSGRYWITYNGEIYNYKEIRKNLIDLGHFFITDSDTEVLLKSYIQWGASCVDYLNGMWAFSIYDKIEHSFFCSRDRLGVKPFYYIKSKEYFAFASEQKSLLELADFGVISREINQKEVFDYFVLGKIEYEKESFFKNIIELKAGYSIQYKIHDDNFILNNYFKNNPEQINQIQSLSEITLIDELKNTFINSVQLRLQSDVPLGACLSGGIDSSSIVAAANYSSPQNFKVFTATFDEEKYNEENYAKIVAKATNSTMFVSSPNSNELFLDLENLMYCQDIPIWSTSTYSQFRLMKLASQNNIKVLLDGQGGDELFGGYPHHLLHYLYYKKGNKYFNQLLNQYSPITLKHIKKYYQKWKFFNHWLPRLPVKLQYQLLLKIYPDLMFIKNKYLLESLNYNKANKEKFPTLNEQLENEINNQLLKGYLKCEDRCSMYFSIESRTPFSDDKNLIDLARRIPAELKIKEGKLKSIFRDAVKDFVPKEILDRKDKMGFATPNKKWIQEISGPFLDKYACNENNEVMDIRNIKKYYSNYIKSNIPSESPRLFKPISFLVWQKVFFNQ
jgi:asparagine synthase (glutamine-hydrolysing)